jgi:hypothetical protein
VNGHRRDDLANDIDQGYPTLSPGADTLAAEVSRLSTFNERQALGRELGDRVAASSSWGEWMQARDRYLAEFDPALVDDITRFLATRRDALHTRAQSRGWELRAE